MTRRLDQLDARMEMGAWWGNLADCHPIEDPQEERDLIARAQSGDKAAGDRLVRSQLRWITQLAGRVQRPEIIPLEDLIGAGCAGLWRAIMLYEPGKRTRLNSYATDLVNRYMWRHVENNDANIRIPCAIKGDARRAIKNHQQVAYLSQPVGQHDDDRTLGEALADEMEAPQAQSIENQEARRALFAIINSAKLTANERAAVLLRHLQYGRLVPLEVVAQDMGLSRERIRQLEMAAFRKMRAVVSTPQDAPRPTKAKTRTKEERAADAKSVSGVVAA